MNTKRRLEKGRENLKFNFYIIYLSLFIFLISIVYVYIHFEKQLGFVRGKAYSLAYSENLSKEVIDLVLEPNKTITAYLKINNRVKSAEWQVSGQATDLNISILDSIFYKKDFKTYIKNFTTPEVVNIPFYFDITLPKEIILNKAGIKISDFSETITGSVILNNDENKSNLVNVTEELNKSIVKEIIKEAVNFSKKIFKPKELLIFLNDQQVNVGDVNLADEIANQLSNCNEDICNIFFEFSSNNSASLKLFDFFIEGHIKIGNFSKHVNDYCENYPCLININITSSSKGAIELTNLNIEIEEISRIKKDETEIGIFKNEMFKQEFIKDDLRIIDKSKINLPKSGLEISDFIIVDGRDYALENELISDIAVRKESKKLNKTDKVNYGFKNLGKDKKTAFMWKSKILENYDKANEFSLDKDFTTNDAKIYFSKDNKKKYLLTFEDVKNVFGDVTVSYDATNRILSAKSNDVILQKSEELTMDPAGEELDIIPLNISDVNATDVISSSATITWATDEPATSQVGYGLTESYGQETAEDTTLKTSHSLQLTGLTPNTLYHYRVKSKDEAGNPATSNDFTFITATVADTTPPTAPIPLSVQESFGINRLNDPVTSGIPFAKGVLTSSGSVRLLDSSKQEIPAQFRTLAKWEDGSVKWLLVDFQASVGAGSTATYYLEYGAGIKQTVRPTTPVTVTEDPNSLTIDTGKAQFRLSKERFNLFEQVRVQGKTLVSAGNEGRAVIVRNGRTYTTAFSKPAKIFIEESGPFRTVIKVEGRHTDAQGQMFFDYIFRLHFYGGQSAVKVEYTFVNRETPPHKDDKLARKNAQTLDVRLEEVALITPLQLSQAQFALAGQTEVFTGTLNSGEKLALFQDIRHDSTVSPSQHAYEIQRNNVQIASGAKGPGWADLSDGEKGLTIAVRYFWQLFPKSLELEPNLLTVGLWPSEADLQPKITPEPTFYPWIPERNWEPQIFYDGYAKTHEVLYYFHDTPYANSNAETKAQAFLNPLIANPGPGYYTATRALREISPARKNGVVLHPRYEELMEALYGEPRVTGVYGLMSGREQFDDYGMTGFGDWTFSSAEWGNLEYDTTRGFTLQFYRTGDRRWLDRVVEMMQHWMDIDTDWNQQVDPNNPAKNDMVTRRHGGTHRRILDRHESGRDPGHIWVEGLLDYYFLTGDERAKDVALLIGDAALGTAIREYAPVVQQRYAGDGLVLLVALYRFTGDQRYLDKATAIVEQAESLRHTVANGFAPALADGFWWEDWRDYYEHKTFHAPYLIDGLYAYYEVITDQRLKDMAKDMIVSTANLMRDKAWNETGRSFCRYIPKDKTTGEIFFCGRGKPGSRIQVYSGHGSLMMTTIFAYAYAVTGDKSYLTFGKKVLDLNIENVFKPSLVPYGGHPTGSGRQLTQIMHYTPAFLYYYDTALSELPPSDTTPPSTPTNLRATAVSSSKINLFWNASTDNVGVTSYSVERCQGSSCTNFAQISAPSGTSYSNIGLSANTTYSYRVRAVDAAGNPSVYSSIASATTQVATTDTSPPVVVASPREGEYEDLVDVDLISDEPATIYYTTDGSNPTFASPVYSSTLTFTSHTTLKFFARDMAGNTGTISTEIYTVIPDYADAQAPTISITSPANNSNLSGTITVSASASDNIAVAGVQFKLDGANLGAEDTTAPYSISWDTTTSTNGVHTLRAVVRDTLGNNTSSEAVTVTINNVDITPPIISNGLPKGVLAAGTTSTMLSVETNEATKCRFDYSSKEFNFMEFTFSNNGGDIGIGTYHNYLLTNLKNDSSYTYDVRCRDSAFNVNIEDYIINFSVSNLTIEPLQSVCIDNDGDEYGVGDTTNCTNPESDCDDTDPNIYPGAEEICDSIDNNCDGTVDEGCFVCGNGIINEAEECDDGNLIDGDGCSVGCLIEPAYTCSDQPSVCLKCTLTDAYWSNSNAVEGHLVNLTVEGNNCDSELVNFEVFEADVFPNPDDPVSINPASAVFIDDKVITTWKAEWQCDNDILGICVSGKPEYYFKSILASDNSVGIESGKSTEELLSVESGAVITIMSPTNGSIVTSSNVTVHYVESGDLSKVDHAHLKLDENPEVMDLDNDGTYVFTDVSDGLHTISTYLVDDEHMQLSEAAIVRFNVKLGDITPPTISNVTATEITETSAKISWSTDEPADSQVEYGLTGLTPEYGNQTPESTELMTRHSETVTGLTPNTLYHYRVKSKDAVGNLTVSGDFTFTTSLPPLPDVQITTLTVKNPSPAPLIQTPVSFGVPFAEALDIQNPNNELTLLDASGNQVPVQWTVLSRWKHQTGSVKWALADFLVNNLAPNSTATFTVALGTPMAPASPLIVIDQSNHIEINTGKIIAKISKQSFNFLDSVLIDANNDGVVSEPLINAGASQGLSYLEDGTTAFNTLGPPEKVIIEQPGPVHSVIRIEGWFKNALQQKEYLYYIARYHFWAGKNVVRVVLTTTDRHDTIVVNWYDAFWDNQQVFDLKLNVKGGVGASPSFWFGDQLYTGNNAKLSQESSYGFKVTNDGALQQGTVEVVSDWYPNSNAGTKGTYQLSSAVSGASLKFTPVLPVSGQYEVFASWASRFPHESYLDAIDVPYTIQHALGSTVVTVPRQGPLPTWYSLGTFEFNAGSSGSVTVATSGKNAVLADAIRFSYRGLQPDVPDMIIYAAPPAGQGTNRNKGIGGVWGSNGGVFLSVKEFWQNYPKAIEVDATGNLTLGLLPGGPHYFMGGMGKTHEFTLKFSPPSPILSTLSQELLALQDFPLAAIAPSQYYYDTKALELMGYTPKPTNPPEDIARWDEFAQGVPDALRQEQDVNNMYSWRHYGDYLTGPPFGSAGDRKYDYGNHQHNLPYAALHQFLRTGDMRWWKYGESAYRHSADIDFVKFRPFASKYSGTVHRKGVCGEQKSHVCQEPIRDMGFEWRYALLHYFLTGDSFDKEIAKMSVELGKRWYHKNYDIAQPIDARQIASLTELARPTAWIPWSLLVGYEEFGDISYLDHAKLSIDAIKTLQQPNGFIGDPNKGSIYAPGGTAGYQPSMGGWALDVLRRYAEYLNDMVLGDEVVKAVEHMRQYTLRKQKIPNPPNYLAWQSQETVRYPLYLWSYENNPSVSNFQAKPTFGVVKAVQSSRLYLDLTAPESTWDQNEVYWGKMLIVTSGVANGTEYEITKTGLDQDGIAPDGYFVQSICKENKQLSWMHGNKCATFAGKEFTTVGVAPGDTVKAQQWYEFDNVRPESYNFNQVNALTYAYLKTGNVEYKNLAQEFFRYGQNRACNRNGETPWPPTTPCIYDIGLGSATYGDPLSFPFLFLNEAAGLVVPNATTDTTPPTRSNGQPTGTLPAGTTSTALGVTTDENANCKYSNVTGTSYSSMPNTFSTTGGTSHSTNVSGLTNNRTYNYYIRCQDAAGNANSNDYFITFSIASPLPSPELDSIPPTVSITSPSSGSTLFGTVTISATASDNVAVAGVQFKLDGSNLGTEDTTAPYSISWNASQTTDGIHTLIAVARDPSNNTATSTLVNVIVNNTQPKLIITSPEEGEVIVNTTVKVIYTTSGDLSKVAHAHLKLDENLVVMDLDNDGTYIFTNVSDGLHTITAYLVDAEHMQLSSKALVTFIVELPPTACGNGIIETGEECDDGNLIDGDGCSVGCLIEPAYTCSDQPSVCLKCTLTDAYWSNSNAVEGHLVNLTVEGNNCDAQLVNFEVWEADVFPNPDDPVSINPASAVFSGNNVTTTWKAEWQCDGNVFGMCLSSPPEYYFKAILDVDESVSIDNGKSKEEMLSVESGAVITITSPINGLIVTTSNVTVHYVESGDLSKVAHAHLKLDENPEVMDLDNDGTYIFTNVSDGLHTITAYLVDAEHMQLSSKALVTFIVELPLTKCGDGFIDEIEECDDSNKDSGDGCSSICLIESGYTCSGQPSVCLKCTLTDAYWDNKTAIEGDTVKITVEGENCELMSLSFVVKEEDNLSEDDDVDDNPTIAAFVNGVAITYWNAEFQEDEEENETNPPEYYFNATLIDDQGINIRSNNLLKVGEAQDKDDDGTPNHLDCNDFNSSIGKCKGCAVCSEDQSLSNNTGNCIAQDNSCPELRCPPLGICGYEGLRRSCNENESAVFPETQSRSCIVEEDFGKCLPKGPESCNPIACIFNINCGIDSDFDGIPDAQDKCPNETFEEQNIYGYPKPFIEKFSKELTTNLSYEDLEEVKDLKIGVKDNATIWFKNHKIKLYKKEIDKCSPLDFDNFINIGQGFVEIKSENLSVLNKSAEITFYNITYINPKILVDNRNCDECKIIGYENNTLVINVSHFSMIEITGKAFYEVVEGPYCGDGICNNEETCSSCSADCGSCPAPSGSSGGGGGGGSGGGSGGGGGGGGALFVCTHEWQCSEWSSCINGSQTRQCEFIKVLQYTQETQCHSLANPPINSKECEIEPIEEIPEEFYREIETIEPIIEEPTEIEIKEEIKYKSKKLSFSFIIAAFAFITMVLIGIGVYEIKAINKKRIEVEKLIGKESMQALNRYINIMKSRGRSNKEIKNELLSIGWRKDIIDKILKGRY